MSRQRFEAAWYDEEESEMLRHDIVAKNVAWWAWQAAESAQSAMIRDLVEALKDARGHARHDEDCDGLQRRGDYEEEHRECDCGLSDSRARIDALLARAEKEQSK